MMKRQNIIYLGFLFAFAAAVLSYQAAAAQDPQPTPSDDEVNRVAKQMFCPVCENIPLDVCPTQACSDWRELIRLRLSEGWSDEQIKEYFAQQYGDRVLAEPPRRGLNLLVYVLPVAALVIGVGILVSVFSSMRKGRPAQAGSAPTDPAAPPPPQPSDDPYLAKLEEELRKKD